MSSRPSISTADPALGHIVEWHPMPSAIWTGSISFGLVQVPVKLVGATKSKDVSFNQLEEGTGARIRYRKVSDADRRGGHRRPDRARLRDLEGPLRDRSSPTSSTRCGPKGSHAIEIEEFVDLDEIDPLYFEQPYYLVPDERGVKPYKLLVDAMTELNKVAIGRIVDAQQGAARRDPPARRHAVRRDDALRRRGRAARRTSSPTTRRRAHRTRAHDGAPARRVARGRRRSSPRSTTTSTASRCSTSSSARRRARRSSPSPQTEAAGQGARPRRRARSVAREGEDREGSPPEHRGPQGRHRRRLEDDESDDDDEVAPSRAKKATAKATPSKATGAAKATKKAPAKKTATRSKRSA